MQKLSELTIQQLVTAVKPNKADLISISPDDSIETALNILATHNLLSLPVQSHAIVGKYTCIISTFDILAYFCLQNHLLPTRTDLAQTVESTMTLEAESESYRIFERDFRDTLADILLAFSSGFHRALITDALALEKPFILTQTDVVRYIKRSISSLSVSFDIQKSIKQLGLLNQREWITIQDTETAWQGYIHMIKNKYLALPIVSNGKLVSALSNSHLRGIDSAKMHILELPVMEFLNIVGSESFQVCKEDTPFVQVLYLLEENHLHRVWVVDDAGRPVGVVTLTTIIVQFK